MEYNKTKRGLEKASAILGIIYSILCLVSGFVSLVYGVCYLCGLFNYSQTINGTTYTYDMSYVGAEFFIMGVIILALAILMLIFSIKLVKSPFKPNGELKNLQSTRIWLLVLSILSGNLVIAGLMIGVLCLKDFKEKNNQSTVNNQQRVDAKDGDNDLSKKIQEIKRFKELGIIDEDTYKKAIAKIIIEETAK